MNSKMLQKYWTPPGPQKTLYIPSAYLTADVKNEMIIFETDQTPTKENAYAEFVDEPIFD